MERIPAFDGEDTCFLLDLRDGEDSVEAEKPIAAETVEILLNQPLATLIKRGRQNTCFTPARWKAKFGTA